MAKTVADQFAETLAAAGVKRIYGIVGDSLNGFTDAIRRQGRIEWRTCPARGGRRLRRRRRGASDRRARRLRRQLRAGQPASHQRPVRLPPLARAGAGHRRADPLGRDRRRAISRRPIRRTLFRECSHYCEFVSGANQMPRTLEIAIRDGGRQARRLGAGACPATSRCSRPASAPPAKLGGLLPRRAGRDARATRSRTARGDCSTATARVTLLCGSGCAGAHDELLALARAPQGAHRACAPRQGARRMGQPLRRRHDRADRLLLRLLRDAGLRRPADARDRLSLSPVLSRGRGVRIAQVDIRAENIGRRAAARSRRGRRRRARRSQHCCRCSTRSATARISTQARQHYAKARKALDDLARRHAGQAADPSAADRQGDQRPWRRTTLSSPATSACRRSGPRAIWR